MFIDKIKAQPIDGEINVIIEIPMNSQPIKYEFDKDSGAVFVDRFVQAAMFYPCNYGFIPHTLSGDGDPVDVLVISNYPVVPACVIRCRAIGVLLMEDESGVDEKIVAVPVTKLDPSFESMQDIEDINPIFKQKIIHFFEHYKDLEPNKWVKLDRWATVEEAGQEITQGIERYNAASEKPKF